MKKEREDHRGKHKQAYERNKKIIFTTQTVCGICGKPVDMTLKYPHPMAKTIDHIVPIDKGGHPSDLSNLQLAHFTCNRWKSNKYVEYARGSRGDIVKGNNIGNRDLPQSMDWKAYRAKS